MEDVKSAIQSVIRMRKRDLLLSLLSFGMIIADALAIWKGVSYVTGSESPIVVVLSGSMEPELYRGDILLLTGPKNGTLTPGDIIVYDLKERQIPIIHRVLEQHWIKPPRGKHEQFSYLTKGDNNKGDDRGLYARNQKWLSEPEVVGRAVLRAPYFGMLTIYMTDYPKLKYLIIAALGVAVLVNREQQPYLFSIPFCLFALREELLIIIY